MFTSCCLILFLRRLEFIQCRLPCRLCMVTRAFQRSVLSRGPCFLNMIGFAFCYSRVLDINAKCALCAPFIMLRRVETIEYCQNRSLYHPILPDVVLLKYGSFQASLTISIICEIQSCNFVLAYRAVTNNPPLIQCLDVFQNLLRVQYKLIAYQLFLQCTFLF